MQSNNKQARALNFISELTKSMQSTIAQIEQDEKNNKIIQQDTKPLSNYKSPNIIETHKAKQERRKQYENIRLSKIAKIKCPHLTNEFINNAQPDTTTKIKHNNITTIIKASK